MIAEALATGDRVLLRRLTAADRGEFLAMAHASRALHHPWVGAPADTAAFDTYVERAGGPAMEALLVCRLDDGFIAGVYNVSEIVRGAFQSGYLGYYAAAGSEGRGLMTEGLRLVLAHAFGTMKLHRLEANIQPKNERSIALVRRCGFRREGFSPRYLKIGGRWRDHERWAITAEEWQASGRRGSP